MTRDVLGKNFFAKYWSLREGTIKTKQITTDELVVMIAKFIFNGIIIVMLGSKAPIVP